MPALNVLIVGNKTANAILSVAKSQYLNKLYTTTDLERALNIQFNTFKELAKKCKSLKIDLVLVDNPKFILQGIGDVLRSHYVNCIAISSDWTRLLLSKEFLRTMSNKYDIEIPPRLLYPAEFPVVLKTDKSTNIVNSLDEINNLRESFSNKSPEIAKSIYLEKYIKGEEFVLTTLFDGKTSYTFPHESIPSFLVEVYNQRLGRMFRGENPNFVGYINSRVILNDDKLYNIGFNLDFPEIKSDILYLFTLALYQKLDEI